jgi:hypothetical protein
VGGLVGAYFGKDALPKDLLNISMSCDISNGTKPNRPESIQPAKSFENLLS